MTEQAGSRLPQTTVMQLKEAGLVGKITQSTEAVMRCAGCPFASGEKFYASRAIKCASLKGGTVIPIVHRLADSKFLVSKSNEKIDTRKAGRPARVLYRISAKARSILKGAEPLPNCQYRDRQQTVTPHTRNASLVPTDSASLADLRRMTDANQGEVAARIGTSQSGVSAIENGEVDAMSVRRIDRYIEALGGTLRIIVDFGEQTFEVRRKKRTIGQDNNG